MKTTGSKNIKDYKINTRILYCHKRHQTPQFEAIISEFSDSGEYVCLEYSPNKTNDWYKVADIIVLDTLKNKQTPVDEVSYEQQEADAIEKECEECKITKDKMIFYDEVDQKMTEKELQKLVKEKPTKVVRLSDYKVFTINDYNQKFYHIDRKSFLNEHYTFSEIQKFIDQGLFVVLKHSSDPMWQKPLSTSNPIPNTTSP